MVIKVLAHQSPGPRPSWNSASPFNDSGIMSGQKRSLGVARADRIAVDSTIKTRRIDSNNPASQKEHSNRKPGTTGAIGTEHFSTVNRHKPGSFTPQVRVDYVPLTAETAVHTNAEEYTPDGGRLHYRGEGALRGADVIGIHGKGDLAQNGLSYEARTMGAEWLSGQTAEGYMVLQAADDSMHVGLDTDHIVDAMREDGFVPERFSGTLVSHASQGDSELRNVMTRAWPAGRDGVLGIATKWYKLQQNTVSAEKLYSNLAYEVSLLDLPDNGYLYIIQFPLGTDSEPREWACQYDNVNEGFLFRPREFTEIHFSFMGQKLITHEVGE